MTAGLDPESLQNDKGSIRVFFFRTYWVLVGIVLGAGRSQKPVTCRKTI